MLSANLKFDYLIFTFLVIGIVACTNVNTPGSRPIIDNEAALNYLKGLKGQWIVDGGQEGVFGWEFDTTSRGKVIVERLKVGTPTEMTTVYYLDHLSNGILIANHYCQLQNQPNLTAVKSEMEGDLHFLCNGLVGNTRSHDELHMHGVHFQKKDSSLMVWMDMHENGKLAFETRYELFRVDSSNAQRILK